MHSQNFEKFKKFYNTFKVSGERLFSKEKLKTLIGMPMGITEEEFFEITGESPLILK